MTHEVVPGIVAPKPVPRAAYPTEIGPTKSGRLFRRWQAVLAPGPLPVA